MVSRLALCSVVVFFVAVAGCAGAPKTARSSSSLVDSNNTLASRMAAMEVEMNRLFRTIETGEIDQSWNAALELKRLQEASVRLTPATWRRLTPELRAARENEYVRRARASVQLLDSLMEALKKKDLVEARRWLLQLDEHRRECHSLFGSIEGGRARFKTASSV